MIFSIGPDDNQCARCGRTEQWTITAPETDPPTTICTVCLFEVVLGRTLRRKSPDPFPTLNKPIEPR